MVYVVTGAAGFIGSNLVKGLNAQGINNVLAVDDLTQFFIRAPARTPRRATASM